jgi:hypothetical protein
VSGALGLGNLENLAEIRSLDVAMEGFMDQVNTISNVLLSVFTVIGCVLSIVVMYSHTMSRIAKLEVKIDTIWDFIMRRALVEGLDKGVLARNSPTKITSEARQWFSNNLINELKTFYQAYGKYLDRRDLFVEIEQRFGDPIMNEICVPHNLVRGSCILAAVHIAEEE